MGTPAEKKEKNFDQISHYNNCNNIFNVCKQQYWRIPLMVTGSRKKTNVYFKIWQELNKIHYQIKNNHPILVLTMLELKIFNDGLEQSYSVNMALKVQFKVWNQAPLCCWIKEPVSNWYPNTWKQIWTLYSGKQLCLTTNPT